MKTENKERSTNLSGISPASFLRHRYMLSFILLFAGWTAIVIVLSVWVVFREDESAREMGLHKAQANFEKDQAFRLWAASRGGVYVEIDDETPPNPYMSYIPERDIETPSGKKLTLMNPAYMVRQMNDRFVELYGIKGNITSLDPIRPENAADLWERKALGEFEGGRTEVSEFVDIDGEPYLRLMRPMLVERSCLKCHASQGYKEGDIRGGVGVSVPMEPLFKQARKEAISHASMLAILWLIGVGGISLSMRTVFKRIREQSKVESDLRISEQKYQSLASASPVGMFRADEQGNCIYVNERWCDIAGLSKEEALGIGWVRALHPEDRDRIFKEWTETTDQQVSLNSEFRFKERNGKIIWAYGQVCVERDSDNNVISYVGTITDITKRKQAEEMLRVAVTSTSSKTGKDCFTSIVTHLAEVLGVRYAIIGELIDLKGETVRTLAIHASGELIENIEYNLKGTPCEDVINKSLSVYKRGVQELFPGDEFLIEMEAQSYVGIPLTGIDGKVLGNMVILDDKPLPDELVGKTKSLLTIFAERVSSELERVHAETKLHAAYKLIEQERNMFTAGEIVVFKWKNEKGWPVEYVSPNVETVFGYAPEEFISGKVPYIEIIPEDDVERIRDEVNSAGDRGKDRFSHEPYRVIRKDGKIIWISDFTTILRNDNGEITHYFGYIIDITKRQEAQVQLLNSQQRLKLHFEQGPLAVIEWSLMFEVVEWNPSAERIFGFTKMEAMGRHACELIVDAGAREHVDEVWRQLCKNTGGHRSTNENITKDGKKIFCEWYNTPLVNADGEVIGVASVVHDITETRRLQELESRAQRLETAGRIAGQVAHDFNNLLAPLVAYPDFIRDELPENHPALEYISDIEDSAKKISEINQQLLALGRRGHYKMEPLNLNDLVLKAVRDMRGDPEKLVYNLQLDDELSLIRAGGAQVYRVLLNLIRNARDAMKENGCITIRSENFFVDELIVLHSKVAKGDYVRLTISDTGTGISEECVGRLFDPFFTTKSTDKERGSGLGLSIVDAVMKDHDGHVDLTSKVGEGTSFLLYFPVCMEKSENTEDMIVGGTESVLVVDDDNTQREVTIRLLEKLGYEASAVESGELAVEFLEHKAQDLIIFDMVMPPGIDGAETYSRILKLYPEQKAIIVSGFAESSRVKFVQELGAGPFVRKPLTMRVLASAVRNELDHVGQLAT